MLHKELFTIDSMDRLRTWRMESRDNLYRTISGLVGGEKVTSEWKRAKGKNIGKSNETAPDEQALLEVAAQYTKKLDNKYYDNRDDAAGKKYFEVMLAEKYKDPKRKKEVDAALLSGVCVFCQPKLDGIRMTLSRHGGISRGGKPFFTVQHIIDELQPLFDRNPDLILDGELYNHELRDDFNSISSLIRQEKPTVEDIAAAEKMVQYHVYDLPSCHGNFEERTIALRALLLRNGGECNGVTVWVPKFRTTKYVQTDYITCQEDLDAAYADNIENQYEGQMVRINAPYENGRSKALLKRKEFFDEEFPLISVEEGKGNWEGYAKSCVIRLPNGEESKAGIKGNQAFTRELLQNWWQYTHVTVRFPNKTPDGVPRFPIAVDWHKGKRVD